MRSGVITGEVLLSSVKIDALSDTELLGLSRDGDSAAFGALWERHRLAGIVAARNIASTLDPDDLVSSAYLKIFELVRDGRGPTGAFRPYLYKVISSVAADTYRSPEHSTTDLTEVPDLTEAGPWEDGAFDLNAAARAFESLPERWQTALWYSEVEGLAPRQIAPILGMSANGVSALSARAKEGLQSAWVETHIDMQLADEACGTTRSRLQRYQLGKLTSRRSREVAAHLDSCDSCAAAAAEFHTLNKQLALVLAAILLGGVPAAALMRSLGVSTAAVGADAAASASFGASNASSASSGASSANGSAASGGSGSAAAGAGAGTSLWVVALATTATLAAAAVGGILVVNTLGSTGAEQSTTDNSDAEGNPESTASPDTEKSQTDDVSALALSETKELTGNTLTTRVSMPVSGNQEKPTVPQPPTQPPTEVLPPLVPPTAPAEIIAGYQCFIPHLDTGEFELRGRASLPGTVEMVLRSSAGVASIPVIVPADRYWSSGPVAGPLTDLDDFLDGTITAEVRLSADGNFSLWETVTATQCAGTGPTVDTSLKVSNVCVIDLGDITVIGDLTEYGVIFARHKLNGTVTQISDPSLEGVADPRDPSVNWSGIFTGSDPGPLNPPNWFSSLPLAPYLGTVADYNAGMSGVFEVKAQTPDGRTSTWMPVDQLIDVPVCPLFP